MSVSEDKAQYNPADRMMSLKGKAYLPVAERIVWFRNDYPEGTIETTIIEISDQRAVFHARVLTGNGGQAEATGTETPGDFGDYIEKAETKAVGRALGYLGYGTAAAGFEEGARVVDAPQERRPAQNRTAPRQEPRPLRPSAPAEDAQETVTDWTGLWPRLKAKSIQNRSELDAAIGASSDGMSPAQIVKALVDAGIDV